MWLLFINKQSQTLLGWILGWTICYTPGKAIHHSQIEYDVHFASPNKESLNQICLMMYLGLSRMTSKKTNYLSSGYISFCHFSLIEHE